ncbi:hypothetical protein GCM10009019_25370 [Salarchaeum japonicum]|uniref:DUF7964 domain-containing protein n=2 Tax=Salarchaeum japonicum TaxID=555573 RepID=A0AAV3T4I7_9EURY
MGEVAALNESDAFELVVPVEREEAVRAESMEEVTVSEAVVLVTESWAKAVVLDNGWSVVESVGLDGVDDRTEALLECERAIEDARLPGERAN